MTALNSDETVEPMVLVVLPTIDCSGQPRGNGVDEMHQAKKQQHKGYYT